MPTSSVAELTIAPNEQPGETNAAADATNSNVVPNANTNTAVQDEDKQARSKTHSNLCAYELKRRTAYESKLLSSSLYPNPFLRVARNRPLWYNVHESYGLVRVAFPPVCRTYRKGRFLYIFVSHQFPRVHTSQ